MEGTVEVKGLGRLDSGDLYNALMIKSGTHFNRFVLVTLVALEISEVLGSFQWIHRLETFVQLDTLNVVFGKKISELKNQKSFSVEILRVGLTYLKM